MDNREQSGRAETIKRIEDFLFEHSYSAEELSKVTGSGAKKPLSREEIIIRFNDLVTKDRYYKKEIAKVLGISRQRLYKILGKEDE